MFSDLSRSAKIAFASVAATAVILATTLSVTLSPSNRESNTASAAGGSSNTNVDANDEIQDTKPAVPCPCFDGDDLDKAIADFSSGNSDYVVDHSGTCTAGSIDGIKYSDYYQGFPSIMGYGIDLVQNECNMQDALVEMSTEEAIACSSILDAKCVEHQVTLEAAVPAPDAGPAPECPCFDASSLVQVIADVKAGNLTLESSSCTNASPTSNAIAYVIEKDYYSWGAEQYSSDSMDCAYQDTIRIVDTKGEWDACKTIVDDACAEIAIN